MSVLYKIVLFVAVFELFTIAVMVESGVEYHVNNKDAVNGLYCVYNCNDFNAMLDTSSIGGGW